MISATFALRARLYIAIVLFAVSSAAGRLDAQTVTATILGTVADPSGAAISGATVTVTNESTGRSTTALSDEAGGYLFPLLPIAGTYEVSVEAVGFRRFLQRGIVLRVNENVRVDAQLTLGGVSESVEVTGAPPQIDTRNSTLGTVIESKTIVEIPLNGRNPIQLASLVAGVTFVSAPAVFTWRGGSTLSVNGSRTNTNEFLVDGGRYAGGYQNNGLNMPSPDALQEFKLITNTFSAEYGRNAGSVFNAVVKSGTNAFHGSLWEFLRNDKLNARNFFLNQPGQKVAKLRQNQFGFTVGGPAIRNRLFWFGSYQGLRIGQESIRTSFLPTAAEREGYFTTPLKDPETGQPILPDAQGRYYISPTRFDPITAKITSQYLPLPLADGRLTLLGQQPVRSNQYVAKADANLTQKNSMSFSMLLDRTGRTDPFPFNNAVVGYQTLVASNNSTLVSVTDTHIFSPTMLSQSRISYHRLREPQGCSNPQQSLRTLGSLSFIDDPRIPDLNPSFNIAGRFQLSSGLCGIFEDSISRQASQNFTWIRGRHTVKFGADLEKLSTAIIAYCCGTEGSYQFNGQITGNAMADYLVGRPNQYTRASGGGQIVLHWKFGGFIQDDWKISRRLTLNLGLRYFLQTPDKTDGVYGPKGDGRDGKAVFRLGQQSTIYPGAPRGLVYVGDEGIPRGMVEPDRRDWQPRIGLAWDVRGDGRTSVRVAYGIFHESTIPDLSGQNNQNQPFILFNTLNAPPGGVVNTERGFPNPIPYRAYETSNPTFILPADVVSLNAYYRQPLIQSWSFNVQQQVSSNFMVDVAYTGKVASRLQQSVQVNPAVYIPGNDANGQPNSTLANVNNRRIYAPVFGRIREAQSIGRSNFHSLQASTRYALNRGLTFTTAYTWSKSIDTISSFGVGGNLAQDPFDNLAGNRGLSDFDRAHVLAASYVYEVPDVLKGRGGKVAHHITGGWEVSGITRLSSGAPYSIMAGVNNSLNGENRDRADVVGDPWSLSNDRSRGERVLRWFNTGAFAVNQIGFVGNSGRNLMRGPAQLNSDVSIAKNFDIGERYGRLQFRSEFYNILNQVRFNNPVNVVTSPAFGQITSALDPRLIQFSLKYLF